ncbi:MAG: PilZ domain-containing protein [Hahellaceae bacterium]|nr:PilZ domain-containing protein [Hahellaceae bacterium]
MPDQFNSAQFEDNQRAESRLSSLAKLYLEVESAMPGEGEAKVVECGVVDFSTNGLQVRLPDKIPQGAILPLMLVFPGHDRSYELMAEVRWIREDSTLGGYLAGFLLFESDGTAILDWKVTVARWLE